MGYRHENIKFQKKRKRAWSQNVSTFPKYSFYSVKTTALHSVGQLLNTVSMAYFLTALAISNYNVNSFKLLVKLTCRRLLNAINIRQTLKEKVMYVIHHANDNKFTFLELHKAFWHCYQQVDYDS